MMSQFTVSKSHVPWCMVHGAMCACAHVRCAMRHVTCDTCHVSRITIRTITVSLHHYHYHYHQLHVACCQVVLPLLPPFPLPYHPQAISSLQSSIFNEFAKKVLVEANSFAYGYGVTVQFLLAVSCPAKCSRDAEIHFDHHQSMESTLESFA